MKSYNKTYAVSVILAIIIIVGCNPYSIPFKGEYENIPVEITSNKSKDSIWLNITQLFLAKGLSIKNLDKSKGVIVSTETPFIPVYTFEDKDGKLEEQDAWVVLKKTFLKKKQWNPKEIYGKWSIQITETGKGTSIIKVAPIVICTYYPNKFTSLEVWGQSTGKLEKLIKSSVQNN